jgi:hypothetical protein
MLILPLKACVRTDVHESLGRWLDSDEQQVSYDNPTPTNANSDSPCDLQFVLPKPDLSAAACRKDLLRLQSLRQALSDALRKPASHAAAHQEGALPDALDYHATLLAFERRGFPTVDDTHHNGNLALTWKGAFAPHAAETHATLLWDRACVTHAIVALLTSAAADCAVTDRAACKTAVGHCQTAAGILHVLQDFMHTADFASVDLSGPMLAFWEAYLLAEGQAFVYRMAALASTQQSTLAYLAQAAFTLFQEALTKAQDPRLASEVSEASQGWATYGKANAMWCAAQAASHMAAHHRQEHAWGLEIGYLRDCLEKLHAGTQFLNKVPDDSGVAATRQDLLTMTPRIRDRLREIEDDNYKIYQETIPKTNAEIPSKQLVKNTGGYTAAMLTPSQPLFVGL